VSPVRALAVAALLAPLPLVAACSNSSHGVPVGVTGTSDACTPDATSLAPGKTTFDFKNEATDVSELVVKDQAGKTVGHVQNVPSDGTRKLTVTLKAAQPYTLTCTPGMRGDGISAMVTVTG
jgi:iron uptake system component EfeO